MSNVAQRRAWSIARFPEAGSLAMVVILWLGFFLVVEVVTAGFAIFRPIDGSLWEPMTQLPRWLAFGAGYQLTGVYLRIHVAHGQTRRGFMRQASVYLVAFAALLATLTMLGYLMELAVYRMAGWPQRFTRDYLFDSASHIAPILFTYGLVYLVWTVAGALIAATFRRLHWYGLVVAAPFCLATIVGIELAVGARYFAPLTIVDIGIQFPSSVPLALLLGIGGFAVSLAATWALVRNMPFPDETG
jgi:hypothetical protein